MTEEPQDWKENLKKVQQSKYFPFDIISGKISVLLKFIEIINKHPNDLEPNYRQKVEQNPPLDYGAFLRDYVVLEIKDFYNHAKRFGKKLSFPPTYKEVSKFRNEIIGHLKKDTQFDLINHYIEININVTFDKILAEWTNFKDKVFEIIDKEEV